MLAGRHEEASGFAGIAQLACYLVSAGRLRSMPSSYLLRYILANNPRQPQELTRVAGECLKHQWLWERDFRLPRLPQVKVEIHFANV